MNRILLATAALTAACISTLADAQSTSSAVTYQPGGTAGGSVYTDWATLQAQHPGRVVFDGSHATPHVPAGTWNVDGQTWLSRADPATGFLDVVSFDDGAHLTFGSLTLERFSGEVESSSPVVELTGGGCDLLATYSTLYSDEGKAPFLRVTGGVATLVGIHELSLGDGTMPVVEVDAPGVVEIEMSNHSYAFANALYGDGELDLMYDADATIQAQPATGLHRFPTATAANVAYAPADPTRWRSPAPGTVAEAVDRIAARMDGGL